MTKAQKQHINDQASIGFATGVLLSLLWGMDDALAMHQKEAITEAVERLKAIGNTENEAENNEA